MNDSALWRDEVHAAGWLAGLIDGEGCVYFYERQRPGKDTVRNRHITISNTDKALVDRAVACCQYLDIPCYVREWQPNNPRHKHTYVVVITGRYALERVWEKVPIVAPEKRRRLRVIMESWRQGHAWRWPNSPRSRAALVRAKAAAS